MLLSRNRGSVSRKVSSDGELMAALKKAKAQMPPDAKVTAESLSQAASKFWPVKATHFQRFLSSKNVTDKDREDLGLELNRRFGRE